MASDAAGVRSPFLGTGVRLAAPAARGGTAGPGGGREALRCAPLRVGPPARRPLRPCGAKDYDKSGTGSEAEGGSYGTPAKRGRDDKAKTTIPGFKEGAKEWVGTWWPQAVEATSKTDKAVAESAQNLGEWAYNLMEGVGTGVETKTSEIIDAVGGAKGQMEVVLGVKKPKPAKPTAQPKEEKKGALSFVGSMPIVKAYFGRKDETEGPPKAVKRVPAKKQVKKPVVPAKEAKRPAYGNGGALQGLMNIGKKAETVKTTNGAEPAEADSSQRNKAQIPILKTFFGDYGPPATAQGKEPPPKPAAPKKVLTPKPAPPKPAPPKPAPPKPDPVVAKKKPEVAKEETYQPPVVKPVATIAEKETPTKAADESGPDTSKTTTPAPPSPPLPPPPLPPPPPPPAPVVAAKTEAPAATPPAKKATTGQGYEKLVKESVGTPMGLGKGLTDKAPKSSGGAVGGPYSLGPKDSKKSRTPAKVPLASTGGGGSGGSYGGSGDGGYGGGDGSSGGAGGDEPERKNPWLLLLAILVVAGGSLAVWYSKQQEEAACAGSANTGKKGQPKAKAQPKPKDCAS